jgi:hypothetical protein
MIKLGFLNLSINYYKYLTSLRHPLEAERHLKITDESLFSQLSNDISLFWLSLIL